MFDQFHCVSRWAACCGEGGSQNCQGCLLEWHMCQEATRFEQLFQSSAFWGTVLIEHTFGHRGLRDHGDWRVTMTATHAGAAGIPGRSARRTRSGVRRAHGAAPLARPVLGAPLATAAVRRVPRNPTRNVASCRVVSSSARREALVLKLKVVAVSLVALVGVGASAAEFASWSQPDPAVDYVAGDPAWAHVTDR